MTGYTDNLRSSRRIGWLMLGLLVMMAILTGRLFMLQIIHHGHYAAAATQEHSRKYEIPAHRGQIYMMDGNQKTPLVLNQQLNIIYADPVFVTDKVKTANAIAGVTGGSASKYLQILNQPGEYAVLDTKIPSSAADKVNALNLHGIATAARDYRVYPEGQLAAQLTGFVNADGVGQYGVEGFLNSELTGSPGHLAAKTDTYGIPIATADNVVKPAVDGDSFVLTIDRSIQAEAEKDITGGVKAVGADSGSVVVMDPYTGAIKAMANYPTYDPNNYGQVGDYSVFSNSVVSNQYEPGSVFKVITMAAGLDTGKVTPDTTYVDTGEVKFPGGSVYNSDHRKLGVQNMLQVIEQSLNTGVVFVLKALGGDPNKLTTAGKKSFYDYITQHFGFGVVTGIEQSDEQAGAVNPPPSNDLNYANMAFGQGLSVTMIQMATAVSAIANGGRLVQPHLVAERLTPNQTAINTPTKIINPQVFSATTDSQLITMMESVVQHGSGFAAKMPGYRVVGKTGTAQIALPTGGYDPNFNIGSFVGFVANGHPPFVMMVRINRPHAGGFAESTTVPVFAKIAKFILQYEAIPPS